MLQLKNANKETHPRCTVDRGVQSANTTMASMYVPGGVDGHVCHFLGYMQPDRDAPLHVLA